MRALIILIFVSFSASAQVQLFGSQVSIQGSINIVGDITGEGQIDIQGHNILTANNISCSVEVSKESYNKSQYIQDCSQGPLTYQVFDTAGRLIRSGVADDNHLMRLPKALHLIVRYSDGAVRKLHLQG